MDNLPLQTSRLQLRPIAEGDEALYCRLYSDPVVMRHIAAPLSAPAAQRAFAASLRQAQRPAPTLRMWVLSERYPCTDIGILALIRHGDTYEAVELGAMLLVGAQGRGLAAEAQTALLDQLFSTSPVRLVWSRNAVGNGPAVSVRRKLGFVPDMGGESGPGAMRWQMTRERWLALRAATDVARAVDVG